MCIFFVFLFFFFNDTATTEIYTLSLHDALPIYQVDIEVEWTRVIAIAREGDLFTIRRPRRRAVSGVVHGQASLVRAIGIHYVDLRLAIAIARKRDVVAVR